jgi:hypothetical protein
MRTKRKYLPILIGNQRGCYLDSVACNYIDPDLETQEESDEDLDILAVASNARQDASTIRRLH